MQSMFAPVNPAPAVNAISEFKKMVDVIEKLTAMLASRKSQGRSLKELLVLVDLDLTVFDRGSWEADLEEDGRLIMSDAYAGERLALMKKLAAIDKLITEREKIAAYNRITSDEGLSVIEKMAAIEKEFAAIQKEHGSKYVNFAYANSPYQLVERVFPSLIKLLREENVLVLGYTSRRTGRATDPTAPTTVQQDAVKSLRLIGVDLSGTVPNHSFKIPEGIAQLENPNLLPYAVTELPQAFEGVVFTGNYPKGDMIAQLIEFLKLIGHDIQEIILIDDNEKYHASLREACEKTLGVGFTGMLYTYVKNNKRPLDPAVVDKQFACITSENPSFPSDAEARAMLDAEASQRMSMQPG